ncbi:hypothetical protein D3C81_1592080 [compost metagenome]
MPLSELEAFAHCRQWRQPTQHQQVFGEDQLDHHPHAGQYEHRHPEHDQQGAHGRQQGKGRPEAQGHGQQVTFLRLGALAACVEKEDQGSRVQRVEQQADQYAVGGRRLGADGLFHQLLAHRFEDDQWQAQLSDARQVAAKEVQGVTQDA